MISYFKNSKDKFVLATGSEVNLFQLNERNNVEDFIYDDPKPQIISEFEMRLKMSLIKSTRLISDEIHF
jgi:hypothetical protein